MEIGHIPPRAGLLFVYQSKSETTHQLAQLAFKELSSLVTSIGLTVAFSHRIVVRSSSTQFGMGKGQVLQVANLITEHNCDVLILNEVVSPRIQRNLEDAIGCAVIDRHAVILRIFADRAKSKEARLQVELAQLEYELPRLTQKWHHLEQQRGGVKGSRGTGETNRELSKRQLKSRIAQLKTRVADIRLHRKVQRKNRMRSPIKTISLAGYTNSGKSTLLQTLCNVESTAKDMLFATLDSQTRKCVLDKNTTVLLTDTVGFIANLPPELIAAFHSTLEEIILSHLIIIVADASHPQALLCLKETQSVLHTLQCDHKKQLIVINKTDIPSTEDMTKKLQYSYPDALCISAKTGKGLEELRATLLHILHSS